MQVTAGRWKSGQSGNPRGRAKGAGDVARLRAEIAKHVPDIIAKQVELAKAGDAQAARLLLERVLPPVKAAESPVQLALGGDSLADQGRSILAALAAGALAPAQAAQLLQAIGVQAKLIETDELAARIAAMEGKSE
jgi:hypothetical protein